MRLRTTLVDCRLELRETIEFRFGSLELKDSPPPLLVEIRTALAQVLEAPSRKVILIGHAGNAEARTREVRARLALGRVEVVRRLLLEAGLPDDRLIARTADSTSVPPSAQRSEVSFEFDPDRPTRTDADPESLRAQRWCP